MYRIYSIVIFCIFVHCTKSKNTKEETKLADNTSVSIDSSMIKSASIEINGIDSSCYRLINDLKDIDIPATYQDISNPDSSWIKLSKSEIKSLIPKDVLEDQICDVYGINKWNIEGFTGIIYFIKFHETDLEDTHEVESKVILALYSNYNQLSDYITLAIKDYGSGFSKIYSAKEIVYLYSAEMEFIHINKSTYSIVDNKFKEKESNDFQFDSSEEGYKKFEEYLNNLSKVSASASSD